jgi:Domain of unknown function (DUF4185)
MRERRRTRLHPVRPLACAALITACAVDPEQASSLARLSPEQLDGSALQLETKALAAQAGYYATPAPGQAGAFTGTDLGWTFAHRDSLWVLFGDSWWLDPVNLASQPDDAVGHISLTEFPDGPSVDAFVQAHPATNGQPAWRAAGPTMPVVMRGPGLGFAPVLSERDGERLRSGIGFVPMTGFSNGRDDAGEGVFALFFSYEHVACVDGQCAEGRDCDRELGSAALDRFGGPCVLGTSAACVPGPGFCQDRSTSIYDPSSPIARVQSVVLRHDVGVTTPADPVHFRTQPWETQRFYNATSRTVTDFDPARADGAGNDYKVARGNALTRAGLFVWGRPSFGGIGAEGRDAQLYLAWVPMPQPNAQGKFEWKPQFFAGLSADGQPQFVARELDARPLDLDASLPGDQPEEDRDTVGQMSISWLPSLERWVMFYGGEGAPMFANALFGDEVAKVRRDPKGSLFVRFAEQPWGPWTPPEVLLTAGDLNGDAAAVDQYAPGGILAHSSCRGVSCARYDPAYLLDWNNNNNGVLYGPSIIDPWTTQREDETDLYWFVSTWNPYQVVLMKTTVRGV